MLKGRFFRRIVELKSERDSTPGLPFAEVLGEAQIKAELAAFCILYRDCIYTPLVTLWMFLSQVLDADQCCRKAVARLLAFRTARGLPPCSTNDGSYCTARKRLPEALLSRLMRQTGSELHEQVPPAWHLHGRPIKTVDGSTVSMPDTPDNEATFGKPNNQKGLVGFPIARIVVVFCLATGAALELAIGPYRGKQSGELSLFRSIQDTFADGDILLGDRLFCTYCDIARLKQRGVDGVYRRHAKRKTDFRRGRRLGREDHLITWTKPTCRPDWMDKEEFAALPDELVVRELRVRISVPGFRDRSLIVITTLTDPEAYSKDDVAALFRQRWQAELDLRSLKTVMQMDVLRCKTAEMVRKELWVHLLAYNLLRSVMCAAAEENGLQVRQLSFKGTQQLLEAFYHLIINSSSAEGLNAICTTLLSAVSDHRVGNRPDRYEPRKRKRAAKPYPAMKATRRQERKRCLRKALA